MAAIERKPYMDRIDRLKQRVLKTKPEMDLENAIILTKGFQESEGQPLCIRKAYAFKKQCLEPVLREAISLNIPVMIECQIGSDDKVFPMVPAGKPIEEAFDEIDLRIE